MAQDRLDGLAFC